MTDENKPEIDIAETLATTEGMPEKNEETAETTSTSTDVDASVAAQNQSAADSTVSDAEAGSVADAATTDTGAQSSDEEAVAAPTWDSIKADTKKLIKDAQTLGIDVKVLVAETLVEV